jgi:hypothetical protein
MAVAEIRQLLRANAKLVSFTVALNTVVYNKAAAVTDTAYTIINAFMSVMSVSQVNAEPVTCTLNNMVAYLKVTAVPDMVS